MQECCGCFSETKYCCIKCKKAVCNVCSTPELNEDADGWICGKQVAYCYSCNRKSNFFSKRKSIISGAVPSNGEKKTESHISLANRYVAAIQGVDAFT